MSTVNVRYMVDDVATAVAWYTKHLGFTLLSNAAPAFADVTLGSEANRGKGVGAAGRFLKTAKAVGLDVPPHRWTVWRMWNLKARAAV